MADIQITKLSGAQPVSDLRLTAVSGSMAKGAIDIQLSALFGRFTQPSGVDLQLSKLSGAATPNIRQGVAVWTSSGFVYAKIHVIQ